nr:hypothetical protein [Tanacetum cinerariifolium]
MRGYTLKQLKQYSFEEINMLFDNTMESIRRFVPMESKGQAAVSKAGEGSSKSGESLKRSTKEELGHEQKVEEVIAQQEDVIAKQAEKESSKKAGGRLKRKTLKAREDKDKRQKKEDGSYKTYIFFSEMLNDFDREDLIVLYRLFNKKYASTRLGFDDLMLWGDMKIMFELDDDDDEVWKNHHSQELIEWKLYDSYGVYSLMLGEVSIHMLVEKKYLLPQDTLR